MRSQSASIENMKRASLLALLSLASWSVAANDFPTQARVEFVLGCMSERGGLSYDTLYPCVCLIDRIAESMSYDEFAEAQVFAQLRSTPGERGGVFRDPDQAETLTAKLESAQEEGESSCFVGDTGGRDAQRNAAPRNVRPATPGQTPPRTVPRDATPATPQETTPESSSDAKAATASPDVQDDDARAPAQQGHTEAAAFGDGR